MVDLFDGADLSQAISDLGQGFYLHPVPGLELFGIFATDSSSLPLVGEAMSVDGPSMLVKASDAVGKDNQFKFKAKIFSVVVEHEIDDGSLVLMRLHEV